jgi:hypothetical protein
MRTRDADAGSLASADERRAALSGKANASIADIRLKETLQSGAGAIAPVRRRLA